MTAKQVCPECEFEREVDPTGTLHYYCPECGERLKPEVE